MNKIAICTPSRPLIDPDHAQAVSLSIALMREEGLEGIILRTRAHSLLEQARSTIATGALEWGADVLLWIDDDIIFEPEDAVAICKTILVSDEVDILGALCSTKRPGAPMNGGLDAEQVTFYEGGSLVRVKGHIGLGMTAHHRRIYDAELKRGIKKARVNNDGLLAWPFFRSAIVVSDDLDSEGEPFVDWLGEDVTFHRHVMSLGFKAWADTRIRAIHRGEYDYRLEDCFFKVQNVDTLNVRLKEVVP